MIREIVKATQTAMEKGDDILKGDVGKAALVKLVAPEEYDSKEYFSWERYFARLLADMTEGTYLKSKKAKLNEVYLHEKNKYCCRTGNQQNNISVIS